MGSMRRIERLGWIAGCVLLFFSLPAVADSRPLETLKSRAVELRKTLEEQDRDVAETSRTLDTLSARIQELKLRQQKNWTLLGNYQLNAKLRNAQQISDNLHQKTAERRKTEMELERNRQELTLALDAAIEKKRMIVHNSDAPLDIRRAAARDLDGLSLERLALPHVPDTEPIPSAPENLFFSKDSEEGGPERLYAVRDFERRLTREVAMLEGELTDIRRQQFVRREASHLLAEESFFGEEGFLRAGPSRPKGSEEIPTSLGRTSSSPSKSAGVPSAVPTVSAGSADLPPVNPPTDTVGGSTTVLESAGDKVSRDPLAQLAGELGIRSKAVEELSTLGTGDSVEQRILWLEKRLAVTRTLLDQLGEIADTLKKRLIR